MGVKILFSVFIIIVALQFIYFGVQLNENPFLVVQTIMYATTAVAAIWAVSLASKTAKDQKALMEQEWLPYLSLSDIWVNINFQSGVFQPLIKLSNSSRSLVECEINIKVPEIEGFEVTEVMGAIAPRGTIASNTNIAFGGPKYSFNSKGISSCIIKIEFTVTYWRIGKEDKKYSLYQKVAVEKGLDINNTNILIGRYEGYE